MDIRILALALSLSFLVLICTQTAWADITRGCSASLLVASSSNNFTHLGTIEARGSCKNKSHANDCRARARSALDACRSAIWSGRHTNAIPGACQSLFEGSSRPGARLQWDGIYLIAEPNRLTARAAYAVCCRMHPHASKLTITFEGRINGDKKCASTKIGKDSYQDEYGFPPYDMDCAAWRRKGICERQ